MEFWFSELHSPHVKFDIRVEKQLFSGESDYQRIDVFQSPEFGKFLTLNGSVIFSEQDCFIYNEMVVHVPMAVHPDVKNVLIIGGGDGGVSKELLQYDNIENIDIVEQDNMFVDVCREYFPETAVGLEDERVHIYNSDALRFLRSKQDMYDLIINDATDMHRKVFHTFPISRVYQAHIPTSPSGYWLFGFASKKYHPLKDFKPAEWKRRNIHTEYYTTNLHTGAFMLPKYVEELLEQEEER